MVTNINIFPLDKYAPVVKEAESWFDVDFSDHIRVCVFGNNAKEVRTKLGKLLNAVSQAVVRMDLRIQPKEGGETDV